jgi:DNA-binding beta-propeller fold protein YncE
MTKEELLKDLESKDFIDAIVSLGSNDNKEAVEVKPDGSAWYIANVREVSGNVAKYYNISFYVIDEGKESEVAYYMEKEPVATIVKEVA